MGKTQRRVRQAMRKLCQHNSEANYPKRKRQELRTCRYHREVPVDTGTVHRSNSEVRNRAKQQQAYGSEPSNPGMRKIGLRYPMSLSPKGTRTGGDSQATSNCGHHPGEMATGRWLQHRRYSAGKERSQTSASRRLRTKSKQRLERQATGILWPLTQRVLAQEEVARAHVSAATLQVRR